MLPAKKNKYQSKIISDSPAPTNPVSSVEQCGYRREDGLAGELPLTRNIDEREVLTLRNQLCERNRITKQTPFIKGGSIRNYVSQPKTNT